MIPMQKYPPLFEISTMGSIYFLVLQRSMYGLLRCTSRTMEIAMDPLPNEHLVFILETDRLRG